MTSEAAPMKKGTKVSFSWQGSGGSYCIRTGITVADEDKGNILVAQDADGPDQRCPVLWCTTKWLTVIK